MSSGTAALQTALDAVTVGPGDEVLLPALSVVMSVAPIVHLGARPVCVDCNAAGTDFDYDDLARKVSDRTAAVLPVHLWGRTGDTARLLRFTADHDLAVVADACQALGSTIDGAQVGIEATIGCFSTHEFKLDTCQDEQRLRRTIHMVDLRTGLMHLLTAAAADPVALCGRALLPAVLVDPRTGYCWHCRSTTQSSIPSQRSSG